MYKLLTSFHSLAGFLAVFSAIFSAGFFYPLNQAPDESLCNGAFPHSSYYLHERVEAQMVKEAMVYSHKMCYLRASNAGNEGTVYEQNRYCAALQHSLCSSVPPSSAHLSRLRRKLRWHMFTGWVCNSRRGERKRDIIAAYCAHLFTRPPLSAIWQFDLGKGSLNSQLND